MFELLQMHFISCAACPLSRATITEQREPHFSRTDDGRRGRSRPRPTAAAYRLPQASSTSESDLVPSAASTHRPHWASGSLHY